MVGKPGSNYRVARSPGGAYRWLVIVLAVAVGAGVYRLGGDNRVQNHAELRSKLSRADDELQSLRANVFALQGEAASLRQRRELDDQARSNVAAELMRLRHQLTDVRRELELYSWLGDQNSAEGGVVVHRFEITGAARDGEYRYDLVLAQALTAADKAVGKVDISLTDIAGVTHVAEHDFEFQVFEKFSGPIVQPTAGAFKDAKVQMKITVRGEAEAIFEFYWRELSGAERIDEES